MNKTKIFSPTLLLLIFLLTSCYKKQTFVSNIDSVKKTCTLYSWVNKFEPLNGFGDDILPQSKELWVSHKSSCEMVR